MGGGTDALRVGSKPYHFRIETSPELRSINYHPYYCNSLMNRSRKREENILPEPLLIKLKPKAVSSCIRK